MDNNIDHINAEKSRIEGGIMHLLLWDENQYLDFKMRCGCRFLQNYMPNFPELIDEILEKPNYWKWWCNQFLLRDAAFLSTENIELTNFQILTEMYRYLHAPDTLVGDLVVDSIVFEGTSITQKPAL